MKKIIPILMSLILLSGMLISSATAQSIGEEITTKGEQVKIAASETGLYIVRLEDASLASYKGSVAGLQATSPEVTGAHKLDVNTDASQTYLAFLEAKQADLVNRMKTKLGRSVEVQFQYLAVLNGMAVALSQAEAEVVATLPGVLTVRPDVMREMDTEVGPEHIGAATIWTGETISGLNTEGEGIVIGMIDSGINHAHPSFAATDEASYTHTNPYGAGVYKGYCATNPGFCNDKLIAAYNFYTPDGSPEDNDGHGSHTASTAGGNRHTATYGGVDVEIQGVAPHANIVAYKVCDPSCPGSASIAAVNSAILNDQVDVLNYSISGSDNPWNDNVDLAFLDATAAGIFVSASAGNSGPGASTVANTGPWNASVGASNHGRVVANVLHVTGPTTPPELQNIPSIPGDGVVFATDVNAPLKYDANNNDGCEAFTHGYFDGSFALVQRGGCSFAVKVANAYNAGADGVVVYNNQPGSPFLMVTNTPPFAAPCVMIDLAYGTALRQYVLDNPSATIFIAKDPAYITVPSYIDTMADFSSRGPSRFEMVKPDYVAPGVNILAAVAAEDGNAVTYDLYQGTSMSSPHGAGAAALMVALNPTWSVAEIKSALAASADPDVLLDYDLAAEADPFDEGSGLLNLTRASRVGLVFDETIANYKAADPNLGGDPKSLNQPSMVNYDCKDSCTWTRTVTSVASVDTTYTVAYDVPVGMILTVTPETFTIAPGADQELTITADVRGLPFNEVVFASVWLETNSYFNRTSVVSLLRESFETAVPPTGWSEYSVLATGWQHGTDSGHSGNGYAWHDDDISYDDAWLVSPAISLPVGASTLSFWERNRYTPSYYELHDVLVSNGSCDPADGDFVQIGEYSAGQSTWAQRTVDLSLYAESDICVAFHYEGNWADEWYIDDAMITAEVQGAVQFTDLNLPVVVVPTAGSTILTVDPTSLEQTLPVDDSATQTLTLSNRSGSDANFEIVEADWLFEGFEGGVMPPAGGWETFHRGTTSRLWTIVDKTRYPQFVYEGEYSAWVNFDSTNPSDEWLLTPAIDATTMVDLELSFMVYSNTLFSPTTMKLWATDIDGVPLTTEPLWDMIRDEAWSTSSYREVIVDLSSFLGMNEIRLAWQYVGQDGDSLGLDNIRLTGAYDIPWLSENPLVGSVPANSTATVDVILDSTGLAPGDYHGLLKVINLPHNDINIPVTLHVSDTNYLYLPLILK